MNDRLVASVPQLGRRPPHLIEDSLPHVLISVGGSIHDTPVEQQYGVMVPLGLSDLNEQILHGHLQLHQVELILDCLGELHFAGGHQSPALLHDFGCLGHDEHTETHLAQSDAELGLGCGLAGAGPACQTNPCDLSLILLIPLRYRINRCGGVELSMNISTTT